MATVERDTFGRVVARDMVRATVRGRTCLAPGRHSLRLVTRELKNHSWYAERGFALAGEQVTLNPEEVRDAQDYLQTVQTPAGDYNHIRSWAQNISSHSDIGGYGQANDVARALGAAGNGNVPSTSAGLAVNEHWDS